jgi:phytoene dehydrogenase-like protein
MDVFRCPGAMLETVTQPIGSLRDKLLIGWLRMRLERQSAAELAAEPEVSTEAYLRSFGFSEAMIDQFFRPFYGGVFLERGLATSSRRFTFIFKMFSQGAATLPAQGMEAIPRQMASRLPNDSVRTGCLVREVRPRCVTLSGGERHEVSAVVVATDGATASQWLPGVAPVSRPWRSVSVIYFAAPSSPLREPILALNGERRGRVNHVCVPSDVAPSYAPPGKSLVSVSVLGVGETGLVEQVRRELRDWFGSEVERWTHLRSYAIPRALPWEGPGESESTEMRVENGVFVCGDHCSTASIEGAIGSGLATAEAVAEKLRPVL